ncbi:MAG: serine/threonine protein kinase [Catenulispora sp.]|nr:serine/threonine protein kinase [Catenulispora sp.]
MADRVLDGRYRLVELLGAGGMGEVWRCHDPRIGREVAVKVLLDVRVTAESLARFELEARVAGSLTSPSIVSVYDYGHGDLDGRPVPYLVMELVAGETLDQVVARELAASRLPDARRALRWTDQVCTALEVAHGVGVVHRDIKPGNVMTTRDGSATVLDFGIARFVGEAQSRAALTAAGVVLGTAGYMSPEQAEGRALDHRTDLYSVGCLLYFLLTGRPPFEAESFMGVAYKHVNADPEPPSRYRRGLPPALDALVLDLLAKEPGSRPADAAAVRRRLAEVRVLMERSGTADTVGGGADVGADTSGGGVGVAAAPPAAVTETAASVAGPTAEPALTPPARSPRRDAPTRFLLRPARHATRMQILAITTVTTLLIAAATVFILTMSGSDQEYPPNLPAWVTSHS